MDKSNDKVRCKLCGKSINRFSFGNHMEQHNNGLIKRDKRRKGKSRKKNTKNKLSYHQKLKLRQKLEEEFSFKSPTSKPLVDPSKVKCHNIKYADFEFQDGVLSVKVNSEKYDYKSKEIKEQFNEILNQHKDKSTSEVKIKFIDSKIEWNTSLEEFINALVTQYNSLYNIKCELCDQYILKSEYHEHVLTCQEFEAKWRKRININNKITEEPQNVEQSESVKTNKDGHKRERLLDICESILDQRRHEKNCKVQTVGRMMLKDQKNNKEYLYWIYNDIPSNYVTQQDINGGLNKIIINPKVIKVIKGSSASKNSKIVGDLLISQRAEVKMSNGKLLKLKNKSNYKPISDGLTRNVNIEHLITGKKAEKEITWGSLKGLIAEIESIYRNFRSQKSDKEIVKYLNEKLSSLSTEELFKDAKPFIRDSIKLKHQDILDRDQETVKRGYIFDGTTLIIDGGPGTGKTTTLVQRIRFLTSPLAIREYYPDLASDKFDKVTITSSRNWVFYTPSNLLAQYLKDNMIHEGLETGPDYIKIWSDEKFKLQSDYGLKDANKSPNNLIDDHHLESFLEEFKISLNQRIEAKLKKRLGYSFVTSRCKNLAKRIDSIIDSLTVEFGLPNTLDTQHRWFNSLHYYFSNINQDDDSIFSLINEVNHNITDSADAIFKNVNEDDFLEILSLTSKKEKADENFNIEKYTKTSIIESIVKLANNSIGLNLKFNKVQSFLNTKLDSALSSAELNFIGEVNLLYSHYKYLSNSFEIFYFNELKKSYNEFRLAYLKDTKIVPSNITHSKLWWDDEISIYISLVNEFIMKMFAKKYVKQDSSHRYIKSYLSNAKNIIAVDEASDLSLADLKCIYSFRDYNISSVTFCGDILQRMTSSGIHDWDYLQSFMPGYKAIELKTSFRQSPTLLNLARRIHTEVTGKKARYIPFLNKHKSEPKPLLFINSSIEKRVSWVCDRMDEVFKAYGNNLPSIAVFAPDTQNVSKIVDALNKRNQNDKYSYMPYTNEVQLDSLSNAIPIFSVNEIKGLEFEVVFFFDLQDLESSIIFPDILLRYVYVGLSRAAYYFGMTSTNEFTGDLAFLNKELKQNHTWS